MRVCVRLRVHTWCKIRKPLDVRSFEALTHTRTKDRAMHAFQFVVSLSHLTLKPFFSCCRQRKQTRHTEVRMPGVRMYVMSRSLLCRTMHLNAAFSRVYDMRVPRRVGGAAR